MNKKVKKAKVYEMKKQTIFNIDYVYSSDRYLANEKELEETYLNNWYRVDGKLERLVKVTTERYNKRWDLKNKDLYNEKLPLVIDEHSKDKYQKILESDLYELKFDTRDIEVELEIDDIIYIDDDVPFMEKTVKQTQYDRWNSKHLKLFLIDMVQFHTVDKCLYPKPLLDLTRPVLITPKNFFIALTDYIYSLGNTNYRIASISDSVFEVNLMGSRNRIIRLEHYTRNGGRDNSFKEDLFAESYTKLIKLIHSLGKKINKLLEKGKSQEIIDLIYRFREENSYLKFKE